MIPKIIHQTDKQPSSNDVNRMTWRAYNPEFEYQFVSNADLIQLFEQHRPDLVRTLNRLPLPAQKADLYRYMALHTFGGIYADADTVCLAPLNTYTSFEQANAIICAQPRGQLLVQWIMAFAPRHPILEQVINRVVRTVNELSNDDILRGCNDTHFTVALTGPVMFEQVVIPAALAHDQTIVLQHEVWGMPPHRQHPLSKALHLFDNSWIPSNVYREIGTTFTCQSEPQSLDTPH